MRKSKNHRAFRGAPPTSGSPAKQKKPTKRQGAHYNGKEVLKKPSPCKNRKADCLHCGEFRHMRGRGLCSTCHSAHAFEYPRLDRRDTTAIGNDVRDKYPTAAREPLPTEAPPGSEAKILELTRRLFAGEFLWHPGDATLVSAGSSSEDQPAATAAEEEEEEEEAWFDL